MKNVGSKSRAARLFAGRHAFLPGCTPSAGRQTLQPDGWEVDGGIFLLDFLFKALARVVLGRGPSYFTISSLQLDLIFVISIAGNPVFHEKTKHFEIDLHLVREKVSDGVLRVLKVASAINVADIFTKGFGIA
ncbi:ribonuclease H-like domain-containing protein [Tanacetum coccineum]